MVCVHYDKSVYQQLFFCLSKSPSRCLCLRSSQTHCAEPWGLFADLTLKRTSGAATWHQPAPAGQALVWQCLTPTSMLLGDRTGSHASTLWRGEQGLEITKHFKGVKMDEH